MLKENKGITLVALVITIIVLLILAGVSIAMIGGENGILTNASEAKTENEKAEVNTALGMAINEFMTQYYAGTAGYADVTSVDNVITKLQTDAGKYSQGITYTITDNSAISITKAGKTTVTGAIIDITLETGKAPKFTFTQWNS